LGKVYRSHLCNDHDSATGLNPMDSSKLNADDSENKTPSVRKLAEEEGVHVTVLLLLLPIGFSCQ
jgi:hypothetical protein